MHVHALPLKRAFVAHRGLQLHLKALSLSLRRCFPDHPPAAAPRLVLKQVRMTDLETSMATIIAVFQKYSEREGDKHKLKKSELRDLLHDELPELMAHVKDQAALDSLMESLDTDGDAECNFQEFMTFVSLVTVCCHEFFEHEDD
ncbi:hypothetical protein OJAV_G00013260 [Oryzias javanicus]|uniref:S100/CaBP-9k-type calcium binding subdomain domain-containing protein n=1 Tax=Oryzias javanicus TaxID=123683 RepID=A0A3S2PJB6_ORYJA|nr:hypothetical protein OJAV_G00013260 [Oryzias javanicus]